ERDAGKPESEEVAYTRASAVGGDHPVGVDLVIAVWRFDGQPHRLVARLDADHPVAPAQVDSVDLGCAINQRLFQIELLKVDEGGHLVPVLWQEIERYHDLVAQIDLAELPGDALGDQALT